MHAIEHTHTISLPCPSLAVSEKKIKLKRKVIAVTKILTDFSIPLTVLTQRLQASQSTTSADSHLELKNREIRDGERELEVLANCLIVSLLVVMNPPCLL